MLSRLHLQNFTVFADADFHFSPGLNVIIGTNGTGKSHVLKVGYAVLFHIVRMVQDDKENMSNDELNKRLSETQDTSVLDGMSATDKLVRIFRPVPSLLSSMIRRPVPMQAAVFFELFNKTFFPGQLTINLNGASQRKMALQPSASPTLLNTLRYPVFIPAKEALTLSWMLPASEQLKLPIDETYLDLLKQLRGLPLQQPEPTAAAAIKHLTDILGGEVEEEGGRYYLTPNAGQTRMEINMVAEGLRKFGTLQKLLSNGSLTPRATLFWDEPEANLNPALLRQLAEVLANLARAGFQIILATHSLFLLKQFHILSRAKDQPALPIRYFGLNAKPGGPTEVTAVDDFELLPDVLALDEELAQADKLTILFAQDDAHTDGR